MDQVPQRYTNNLTLGFMRVLGMCLWFHEKTDIAFVIMWYMYAGIFYFIIYDWESVLIIVYVLFRVTVLW
uniref:Putative ovule protein n=1 Tax=Solanum chacoense TaxID=4108 RepID=A0A0V0HWJ7_SOLCH